MRQITRQSLGTHSILFDFDGVLADSEPLYLEACRRAFAPIGHSVDEDEYYLHWASLGEGVAGENQRHQLKLSEVEQREIISRRDAEYDSLVANGAVPLFPHTLRMLEHVASNRKCAIASNSKPAQIKAIFLAAGVPKIPVPVFGLVPGLRPKPAPDIFLNAARQLGVERHDLLVIEDSPKGLLAAKQAKIAAIAVRGRSNRDADLSDAMAVLDAIELLSLLGVP